MDTFSFTYLLLIACFDDVAVLSLLYFLSVVMNFLKVRGKTKNIMFRACFAKTFLEKSIKISLPHVELLKKQIPSFIQYRPMLISFVDY